MIYFELILRFVNDFFINTRADSDNKIDFAL